MKNRVRDALAALAREGLERAVREAVAADLQRVQRYFEEPSRLPAARGIALFACGPRDVFDVLPLPHVHRSRLAVTPVPLVRELLALEEEFGTILVAACDRTAARLFAVTAYDIEELPSLTALAPRPGNFPGARHALTGTALARGQVRPRRAHGNTDDPRAEEAIDEALRQRARVDALYDDKARRAVDGLAALLRFRR